MPRFVLIDQKSGFVWGDAEAMDAIEACRIVDEKCGAYGQTYEEIGAKDFSDRSGYHVYRAPEEFVDCGDGRDPEYIKMVEAFPFVTCVAAQQQQEE